MAIQTITPALKKHLDSQLSFCRDLTKRTFSSAQKIYELNLKTAQAISDDCFSRTSQMLLAKDPSEAISVAVGQLQPAAEKIREYQQQLTDVIAGVQVELVKTAESHIPETSRTAAAVVDEMARRAAEETDKVTQGQRSAMERMTTQFPPEKTAENKASTRSTH